MDHIQWTDAIVKQIQSEHREQAAKIRKAGVRLTRKPDDLCADFAEARTLLVELRDHLADHFAREENGGFLDEAIAHMPSLAIAATAVEKEHVVLLAEIDAMIARIPTERPTVAQWETLGCEFRTFAQVLNRHEATENRLLQQGFNEDLTTEF